jgi:hypothetical protein
MDQVLIEIQNLRDHCNKIIKMATQVGVDNIPGFAMTNDLLRNCDRVFHAVDLVKKP